MKNLAASLLLVLAALLSSCATTGFDAQSYTVKSGDTLYFIAWKYKLDFKQLASWNQLQAPYAIYPGDRILIRPVHYASRQASRPVSASRKPRPGSLSAYTVRKGDTLYSIAREQGMPVSKIITFNQLRKPYVIYPGQRLSLRSDGVGTTVVRSSSKPKPSVPRQQPGAKVAGKPAPSRWLWPTEGRVVRGFKGRQSVQQGIDISGRMGQTVHSSAAGIVVYSGKGLASYGQLIIVKHNDDYLSAYGYNSQLLVKEGDKVKAGQAIAKMGRAGQQGEPQLHFEIRKQGKPVNPMRHLPNIS